MRVVIGIALLVGPTGGTRAEDKIDVTKLIGKWEVVSDKGPKIVVEYAADGKLTGTISAAGQEHPLEGTYKVDGNKLTQTMSIGGKEPTLTLTLTVTKLTDDELAGENDKGVKSTFKRVKK
jgi:uncharacterized protein (TIGR03066 family)